jgi:hypothetical protein
VERESRISSRGVPAISCSSLAPSRGVPVHLSTRAQRPRQHFETTTAPNERLKVRNECREGQGKETRRGSVRQHGEKKICRRQGEGTEGKVTLRTQTTRWARPAKSNDFFSDAMRPKIRGFSMPHGGPNKFQRAINRPWTPVLMQIPLQRSERAGPSVTDDGRQRQAPKTIASRLGAQLPR